MCKLIIIANALLPDNRMWTKEVTGHEA